MKPVIEVKQLSKRYRLGGSISPYLSIRDSLGSIFKSKKKASGAFWALNDISFDVYPGESLAIIGKNGAGKSTLLKILSKITPPTKGEIIARGRIASLLEVGTGFHAELTGRENIFLNGSILGLTKKEIKAKFDEIVDFSGVERFLDTPLKHYSSGMQLRLAFSVAVHLEPEVLAVDEVLAVGDSVFQQQCINKMTEIREGDRTLLFVSHNMSAIRKLCKKAILLDRGQIIGSGNTEEVIAKYLSMENRGFEQIVDAGKLPRDKWYGNLIFKNILFDKPDYFPYDSLKIDIELDYRNSPSLGTHKFTALEFGISINNIDNESVYHISNLFLDKVDISHKVDNVYSFKLPRIGLRPGSYSMTFFLRANHEIQDWLKGTVPLTIKNGNLYHFSDTETISGQVQPDFEFFVNNSI